MVYRVTAPRTLDAYVSLPASKSISNRALILNALSGARRGLLTNLSDCDDTRVMLAALAAPGAERVDVGAAGTSMRFLTAYLSLQPGRRLLTGSERMCHRPIGVLVDALRCLGAQIRYAGAEGFPPLEITGGEMAGGDLEVDGNVSSQYVSALLMVGPLLREGLRLHLRGRVVSRPYIHMTVAMMRTFGAEVRWRGGSVVEVAARPYTGADYTIEPDWSAASYWFEIMSLAADDGATVRLPYLSRRSLQGDAGVCRLFSHLSVEMGQTPQLIRRGQAASRLVADLRRMPDVAQTVVVACAVRGVAFRLTGLETLRIKETDRITALCNELSKLGVRVEVEDDGSTLFWRGPERQPGGRGGYLRPGPDAVINTYDDHRMAMAFAPAALAVGTVAIADPHVVTKSYPAFWDDLRAAGFIVEEQA